MIGDTAVKVLSSLGRPNLAWEIETPSGSRVGLKNPREVRPEVYFRFVKFNLSESTREELERKSMRLKKMAEAALEGDQIAVKEELVKFLAACVREMECLEAGYGKYISSADINKYLTFVKGKTVEFKPYDEFPRVVPHEVREKYKEVKDMKLFDEYYVLFNNPSKQVVETTAKKVEKIEKDPILFGRFKYDKNRFFYITDWVDEYCDITLESFTKVMKDNLHPSWEPDLLEPVSKREIEAFKKEAMTNHEKVEKASAHRFGSSLMAEKRGFWSKLKSLFRG